MAFKFPVAAYMQPILDKAGVAQPSLFSVLTDPMENLPDLSEEDKAYVKCVVDMKVPILAELMQV
jgi:hypothetical protein